MKLRKAIKRIAALGMGSVMVGATLMGAMAYDLRDYPTPFVMNGKFNAVYVVGRNAAAIDVAGVTPIVTAIPTYFAAATPSAGKTAAAVDGAHFLETAGTQLVLGDYINAAETLLDDGDLPNLLADGSVDKATGSGDYDYQQQIEIGSCARISFGVPADFEDSDEPIVYIDTTGCTSSSPMYTSVIDFENAQLNLSTGEDIWLFGRKYTLSNDQSEVTTSKVVLQATSVTDIVSVGETRTINGVEVKVLGANTDSDKATVVIDGKTKQVSEGQTVTTDGDVNVFIKQIFLQTVPTPTAAIEVSVGGSEITLEHGEEVSVDDDPIDGTMVTITTSAGNHDQIRVGIYPNSYDYEGAEDEPEVEYIEAANWPLPSGESANNPWVDPVWHSFKVDFVGLSVPLDSDERGLIEFKRSSRRVDLSFTNKDNVNAKVNIDFESDSRGRLTYGNDVLIWAGNASNHTVAEKEYFLLNTGNDPTYTYVVKYTSYSNSSSNEKFDCNVVGMSSDPCDYIDAAHGRIRLKQDVPVNFVVNGAVTLNIQSHTTGNKAGIANAIFTKEDAKIVPRAYRSNQTVAEGDGVTGGFILGTRSPNLLGGAYAVNATNITQDVEGSDYDADDGEIFTVRMTYDASENEADISTIQLFGASFNSGVTDSDADKEHFLSDYGTYVVRDTDDSAWAKIWVPTRENAMRVAVAGVDVGFSGADGAGGSSGQVVVPATAQKFADEISNVQSQNIITVGGPCANSVSAALMGNPADCARGFEPGKGIIKLFEHGNGNVALMVAGYSGDDTLLACRVVADRTHLQKQAAGVDEIIVQGTSLSQVTVSYPTMMADDQR